ncbi:glycosyltransferase [Elizabethkingia sp. JS20170427COW]|uniref:glycosyltransferase n=1 Tax=Elizabethkingia sp. JS20170427COW TaxID=2583851 RepID=UPI0011104A49|nr:glycosyltransferase [Elizabethkingia sp. JS20170427COW]QCX53675.1 glycosyltransferase family 1 protein [Elizabethkingia sp. JS20170427COW]
MERILHVIGAMNRAGAETFIMNLYRSIDKNKYQFDFYCTNGEKGDYDAEIIKLGGRIHYAKKSNTLNSYLQFYKFLKQHRKYKIIHAHILLSIGIYSLIAKIAGVEKIISHAHSSSYKGKDESIFKKKYYDLSVHLIKNYADIYLACGKKAGDFLYPFTNNYKILPNSIDLVKYKEIAIRDSKYLDNHSHIFNSENKFKLIQVGRFNEVKNHTFTLNVIDSLRKINDDFILYMVGDGELKKQIEEEVKRLKLDDYIIFLGVRDDVPSLMAGSDLLLMPSHFEGFPVVLVESQAIGLEALISNNISKEVDLDIGLINFETLDDYNNWANIITEKINNKSKKKNVEYYFNTMKKLGFDNNVNVKKITDLYRR